MPFPNIIVPIPAAEDAAVTMPVATSLARSCNGNVEAVFVRQRPILPAGAFHPYAAPMIDAQFAQLEAAEAQLFGDVKKALEAEASRAGLPIGSADMSADADKAKLCITDIEGHMPTLMAAYARTSDLTIIAHPDADASEFADDARRLLIQEVIFQSGRPVLLLPKRMDTLPGDIVIAWDGGRAAAVAMMAAYPLLKAASSVKIVSVGPLPLGNRSAADAAASLSRHGISATSEAQVDEAGISDHGQFAKFLGDDANKLVVMGGFSHSRLRELVLGGFTKTLLKNAPCPVLMAH